MRSWLALTLVCSALVNGGQAAPHFKSVAIFPAENKHNHASCVIELANGDLLAAWYRGSGERSADDVQVMGSCLSQGATGWGPPYVLADTPGYPDCNPALFAAPDRTVWLFWPTILDHRWEGALLKFAVADDTAAHSGPLRWRREGVLHVTPSGFGTAMDRAIAALPGTTREAAKPALDRLSGRSKDELYQRLGWMPRVHPIVLPSGRWLLPLYSDTFDGSIVAISDDQGASWSTSEPMLGFGNIQPSLVRRDDGTIVAFMRDNGTHRKIRLSTSKDDGRTWSAVTDSAFPNPGAGIEAARLASGHWALVYNDAPHGRHSLAISISTDQGQTWKTTRHIERIGAGLGQFHYPSLLQSRDGLVHVTYTRRIGTEGSTIQHATFNEAWVLEGDKPSGKIETIAGTGKPGSRGDGGKATEAQLHEPFHGDLDGRGHLYIADTLNHRIRKLDLGTGIITTVAGNGDAGHDGDGRAATDAAIGEPYAVVVDGNEHIYFVDQTGAVIRKVDTKTGLIATVAGNGRKGYSGDGGPGTEAQLREPNDCVLDGRGGLLIADVADWRVRRLDLKTGVIRTFAGTGRAARKPERSKIGDGGKATEASVVGARAVCVDGEGNTYLCEREGNAIRKVDPQGVITTIAGTGNAGYTGDGGDAAQAAFNGPKGVRCDRDGNLFVVDTENHAIRRIDAKTNVITTVAGGTRGAGGDGGKATKAGLDRPHGCVIDAAGALVIFDGGNHRVRKVSAP